LRKARKTDFETLPTFSYSQLGGLTGIYAFLLKVDIRHTHTPTRGLRGELVVDEAVVTFN
jgi:hypothetical protein